MDSILQQITDWLKEMLVSAIMGNLSGMFESVNNQVGEIATSVGMTPANFSPGVFAMVRNISESVIIPIAGLILTFIACYELIQIYIEYRKSGYSKKFFEEHRQEITIHKAAKQAFDELQITKLPSMQSLYEEFHQLAVQKKQDYAEYRQIRKEKEELLIAKRTVETILNIDRQKEQEKEKEKEEKKNFR